MIDREKVIKAVEEAFDMYWSEYGGTSYFDAKEWAENKRDALFLLKEQEAVEPVLMREGRNEYYNDYVCPECDNELVFGQNFCSECGRQVKWDGRT